MSHRQVVRAWTDPKYRRSLSKEQLAALPESPAGLVELRDDQLSAVPGGKPFGRKPPITTAWFCTLPSFFFGLCGCP
jgi:mersacidin/lichenicidin family type 2 lantibiotic